MNIVISEALVVYYTKLVKTFSQILCARPLTLNERNCHMEACDFLKRYAELMNVMLERSIDQMREEYDSTGDVTNGQNQNCSADESKKTSRKIRVRKDVGDSNPGAKKGSS